MNKISILAILVVTSSMSHGQVAINTFGTTGTGYSVDWHDIWPDLFNEQVGTQFQSQTTGIVNTIELAMDSTPEGTFVATLLEDNSDTMGTVIQAWEFDVSSQGIYTITNSSSAATLAAGSKYWLRVKHSDSSESLGRWFWSDPTDTGLTYRFDLDSGGLIYGPGAIPAYKITTTPVPEPTTLALLAMPALAALRRRKK